MMDTKTTTPVYLLHTRVIRDYLDRRHRSHRWAADHLGICKSYWSQLVNRRRPLSPMVRQLLLRSDFFGALTEGELWERVPRSKGPGQD